MAGHKSFSRKDRVSEQIRREIAELVRVEVKDPRVGMVTLQSVEVTPDYAHAKVYFTSMTGSEGLDEILKGLRDRYEAHHRITITDEALVAAATLAEHWALHCHRVAEADAGAVITDLECLRQRHRALRAGLFEHCQRIGVMCAAGEQWRFTAAGAWRYLRQVMAGNRRVAALPPSREVEEPSLRVAADKHAWQTQEAVTRHNVMSRRGKLLWFAISLLAGAAAFGAAAGAGAGAAFSTGLAFSAFTPSLPVSTAKATSSSKEGSSSRAMKVSTSIGMLTPAITS